MVVLTFTTLIKLNYLHGSRRLYIDDKTHPSLAILTEYCPRRDQLEVNIFSVYDNYQAIQTMVKKVVMKERLEHNQKITDLALCRVDVVVDNKVFRCREDLVFEGEEVRGMYTLNEIPQKLQLSWRQAIDSLSSEFYLDNLR